MNTIELAALCITLAIGALVVGPDQLARLVELLRQALARLRHRSSHEQEPSSLHHDHSA